MTNDVPIPDILPHHIDDDLLVIRSFNIDTDQDMAFISLTAVSSGIVITVIPEFVSMTNINADINIHIPTKVCNFKLSGVWIFNGVSLNTTLSKNGSAIDLVASSLHGSDDLLHNLTKQMSESLRYSPWNNLKLPSGMSCTEANFHAEFLPSSFATEFSTVAQIPDLGECILTITTETFGNATAGITLALTTPQVKISNLIGTFLDFDVSSVPIIGSLEVPETLVILSSASNPYALLTPSIVTINNLQHVYPGLTILFDANVASKDMKLLFSITEGNYYFDVMSDDPPTAEDILKNALSYVGNIDQPFGFDILSILDMPLDGIVYEPHTSRLGLVIEKDEPIYLMNGAVIVDDIKAKFGYLTRSENCQVGGGQEHSCIEVEVYGLWSVGNMDIPLRINKSPGSPIFTAISSPTFDLEVGSLITKFGVALLPAGPLQDAINNAGFTTFKITNPVITLMFASNFAAKVTGKTVIGSWSHNTVEIIFGKVAGATVLAMGIELGNVQVNEAVKTLTQDALDISAVPGISILDETEIAIVVSSQEIPSFNKHLTFNGALLSNIAILDGVSVVGKFNIPQNCGHNQFCNIMRRGFGSGPALILTGRLAMHSLELRVLLPTSLEIFEGIFMIDIGLIIDVGLSQSAISLTGSVYLDSPPLLFVCELGISTSGLFVSMSTKGTWELALGVPFLSISDLHFVIAIVPDPIGLTKIEMGGTAHIGVHNNAAATPIIAQVYVGIDRISPTENYFLGGITRLTLEAIINAFGQSAAFPAPFNEIGFPEGVNVSFASTSKQLHNGIIIPRGFYLKGRVNVLFFGAMADISLDLNGIFVNMTVDPFSLAGGLIKVDGAGLHPGPLVFVDLTWNPPTALLTVVGLLAFTYTFKACFLDEDFVTVIL